MNPRRWAHQTWLRRAPRSRAISSAIRFSNPSRRSLEKGRLFGSAQTRSSRAGSVARTCATVAMPMRAVNENSSVGQPREGTSLILIRVRIGVAPASGPGQGKDVKHATLGGVLREVLHGVGEAERDGRVLARHDAEGRGAGPAAHSGENCHILAAVGPPV